MTNREEPSLSGRSAGRCDAVNRRALLTTPPATITLDDDGDDEVNFSRQIASFYYYF